MSSDKPKEEKKAEVKEAPEPNKDPVVSKEQPKVEVKATDNSGLVNKPNTTTTNVTKQEGNKN